MYKHLVNIAVCYVTVFLTSVDDAVWLLPYLVSPSKEARFMHGVLFVLSLQLIVFVSWIISLGGHKLIKKYDYIFSIDSDALTSVLAALGAWVIFFCVLAKRRHKNKNAGYTQVQDVDVDVVEAGAKVNTTTTTTTTTATITTTTTTTIQYSPKTVFFSSLLNACDELCYFPPLLVSQKILLFDLSFGALLACVSIIFIVSTCLARCRKLVEISERIQLLGVLGVLALSLTIEAARDVIRS